MPLLYFQATGAVLLYLVSGVALKEEISRWLSSGKLVAPKGDNIQSGTILTFARAMGEYGATSMLAGNIPGKTGTVSQQIAMVVQDGDYLTAGVWVFAVMLIAFAVIFIVNLISAKKMKQFGH